MDKPRSTLGLILILIVLILLSFKSNAQYKVFSRNDIAVMSLQAVAGYAQGWREEVLYHPNALFRNYPNLNRSFWDSREWKRWNANHLLKTIVAGSHTAAIVIKLDGKKKNWKLYALDAAKYYGSYKLGFFAAYNLTHKNKFTF